jgi:hypothetical protein
VTWAFFVERVTSIEVALSAGKRRPWRAMRSLTRLCDSAAASRERVRTAVDRRRPLTGILGPLATSYDQQLQPQQSLSPDTSERLTSPTGALIDFGCAAAWAGVVTSSVAAAQSTRPDTIRVQVAGIHTGSRAAVVVSCAARGEGFRLHVFRTIQGVISYSSDASPINL